MAISCLAFSSVSIREGSSTLLALLTQVGGYKIQICWRKFVTVQGGSHYIRVRRRRGGGNAPLLAVGQANSGLMLPGGEARLEARVGLPRLNPTPSSLVVFHAMHSKAGV